MKNYNIGDKITLEVKEVDNACKGCFFEELSEAGCPTCCAAIDCDGVIFAEVANEPTKQAPTNAIDWEQRRYEIAKDVYSRNPGVTEEEAIWNADALIKELKRIKVNEQ